MREDTSYCLGPGSQSSINYLERIKNKRRVEKITCGMLNSFDEPRDIRRGWKI